MLKITLDEAYAFDMLSIYQIKKEKFKNFNHLNNFKTLYSEIENQIGKSLLNEIVESKEYIDLFYANKKTFELVDAVKLNPCLGKDVDDSNYERYLKKIALQKKFFNTEIKELKSGY